ncbi:SGNH/GDSL hydrolase family protein [Comamonas testosteroni]|uniref:SGNH/GDSL hydrolase family protein n=1 Tax=Comamonas testosteroni TaxID=285 RepID=UPI00391B2391
MPTDNPIPSPDPSDLLFNAPRFDEFMNGENDHFTDRKGRRRNTLSSLERDFPSAADNMAAAKQAAVESLSDAERAVDAAERSESARDSALAGANIYPTEAAGRAAVGDGETFNVQASGDIAALVFRRVNAATSVQIAELPSANLAKRVPTKTAAGQWTPVVITNKRVFIWADESGRFACEDASDDLAYKILGRSIHRFSRSPGLPVPLAILGKTIPAWIDEFGRLGATGLTDNLITDISQRITVPAPVSSGASLSRFRARAANVRAGKGDLLKIAIAGDSWAQRLGIPLAVLDKLSDAGLERKSIGFINSAGSLVPSWVTVNSSGWTVAAATAAGELPYRVGPDGMAIYTTGSTATVTITGEFTKLDIFYRQYGGTFRVRVDGGAFTVIASAALGGASALHTITGLGSGQHTVSIDTVGNTGVPVIGGYYATSPGSGGVELLKLGIGGLDAPEALRFVNDISDQLAVMQPDVLAVFLGTNDYRKAGATPEIYKSALRAWIAQARVAVPDIGVILIAPPLSGGVVVTPQSSYRDAVLEVSRSEKVEYLLMHDTFGAYAQSLALDQWEDTLHLGVSGEANAAEQITNLLQKV